MILQFPGTRTQGLMTRVEEMERALTARLVNNQPSKDSSNSLPPIEQTMLKEDAFENGKPSLDKPSIRDEDERLDELHSQVRAARSDNVILRQDLQSLHDRESQFTRRNRDLEDKLLRHRAEYVDKDQKKNQRAELDLNIDFTMPNGRAVITERDPAKVEKKVATVPPLLEKTSFDSDNWKVTVTSKHKGGFTYEVQ